MVVFRNPKWIDYSLFDYLKYEDVPTSIFDEINDRLDRKTTSMPEVSIIISAWNEETNIIRCVYSLSKLETDIPFEIIVVNNNSTDKTQDSIEDLHVKTLFQEKQGCGPARQLGQEKAKGPYILIADADCIYPPDWLTEMMKKLKQPGVVAVYGRYSFLEEKKGERWKYYVYEKLKNIIAELRHIKRPYLNAYGISMGYLKEAGLKAGYIDHNTRGDDGRIVFDMMKYGKVKQVRSKRAGVWTKPRTLHKEGSLSKALLTRLLVEINRWKGYFHKHPDHDTKSSSNGPISLEENIEFLKKKLRSKK